MYLLWSAQKRTAGELRRWEPVQMGTLGAGNHYAEIQVIDKVFDDAAARKMGIDQEGQVSFQSLAREDTGFLSAASVLCTSVLHLYRQGPPQAYGKAVMLSH